MAVLSLQLISLHINQLASKTQWIFKAEILVELFLYTFALIINSFDVLCWNGIYLRETRAQFMIIFHAVFQFSLRSFLKVDVLSFEVEGERWLSWRLVNNQLWGNGVPLLVGVPNVKQIICENPSDDCVFFICKCFGVCKNCNTKLYKLSI